MPELAYVNGAFMPIERATVSVEDRGFQFGDGVYEVIVAYGGKPFLAQQHLARLRTSCAAIDLNYDFTSRPLEPIIHEGLERSRLGDTVVYMQITRGAAPRAHVYPRDLSPTLVLTFRPLVPAREEIRESGIRVISVRDNRWSNCYVKAITLLPNILARNEAIRRGYDDALFVAESGEVRECTASNVFIIRKGALTFPPRDKSVLHGITQDFLLECAASIGLPVREEAFNLPTLLAADEVFLSSTILEVLGIVGVEAKAIGDGKVGPVTRRLHQVFRERSRAAAGGARDSR